MTNEEYKELRKYEDKEKEPEKEKSIGRAIFKVCLAAILIPFVTVVAIVGAGIIGVTIVIPEVMLPVIICLGLISVPGIITGIIISKKY